jgi:hypothetical protein
MADEKAEETVKGEKYVFHGSSNQGEVVDRLVLGGTSTAPERYLDSGGAAGVLTEEEVKKLRNAGYKLTKQSGEVAEKQEENSGEVSTPEQQQEAQRLAAAGERTTGSDAGKKGGK